MKRKHLFLLLVCSALLLTAACNNTNTAGAKDDYAVSSIMTDKANPIQPNAAYMHIMNKPDNPARPPVNAQSGYQLNDFETALIKLINAERTKRGIPALRTNMLLSNAARYKALDMQERHYFSHFSPSYGSPFKMMTNLGIPYQSASENIANGQPSPQDVLAAWMNSKSSNKDILNAHFTHIGISYLAQNNYWVMELIQKRQHKQQ